MKITSSPRDWTRKENNLLRRVYAQSSFPELMELFRRSGPSIKSRARVLGLKRGNRKRWTPKEDALLRKLYPNSSGKAISKRMNIAITKVYQRAARLGLEKSAAYLKQLFAEQAKRLPIAGGPHRFRPGHVPANKGLRRPGYAPGRMAETQFKKGQRTGAAQHNWWPIGTVLMNPDGYLRRKIADKPNAGTGAHSTNWEFVHRRVWEDAHGPIPKGFRIWWKDRDHTNCALDNLELLSPKEHMGRTTLHNLPQELRQVIQLKGALKRQINQRSKANVSKKQNVRSARSPIRDVRGSQGRREAYGS